MQWAKGLGRASPPPAPAADRLKPGAIARSAPGLAALFERIAEDGRHAVLDLGPASGDSLRVYSRFARWVRFADVLTDATSPGGWHLAKRALRPNPARPYDVVFAWDILDRLPPAERPLLMKRLAEISAPDASLFGVFESPDRSSNHLLSFSLASVDAMLYENSGELRPAHPLVGPAEVKGLLEPFRVLRAFSSQVGLREYVAVRHHNGSVGRAPLRAEGGS